MGYCSQFSYPGQDNHPALLSTRSDKNGFVDDRRCSRLQSDPSLVRRRCDAQAYVLSNGRQDALPRNHAFAMELPKQTQEGIPWPQRKRRP
jgi:hypothetical protein